MKQLIATLAASALVLVTAATALAAAPARDSWRSFGPDDFSSDLCGFEVTLVERVDFVVIANADGSSEAFFHAERKRTGPGGSITQLVHYTWTSPDGFSVSEDPATGTIVESYREILHGSRIWTVAGEGRVLQDAGMYAATVTVTYPPDGGEIVEVTDEVAHGQQPSTVSQEEANAILCGAIA